MTATTFEFEHTIPRSAGKKTVFDNLCLADLICNQAIAQD
ncbi:HNH endonuclease [Coleofasciculus sp. G3-WIS-01]